MKLNARFSRSSCRDSDTSLCITGTMIQEENIMERRNFLKLAFGIAAGAAFTTAAQAAPLSPQSLDPARMPQGNPDAHPAVTTRDEAAQLKPEQVHWHGHGHWHRRHWGWRHRHWGWRRRWHRRHWRHW